MADITDLIYEDHAWFRRQFFYLDDAESVADLTAIWEPLAARLDLHADAEETVFYPALLQKGTEDGEDEAEDAIDDHNAIRDAVAEAAKHRVGTKVWWEAVTKAREENGEHLEEEEREALTDFRKNATYAVKHELAMAWLRFYHEHTSIHDVDESDKDADEYIRANS